MHNGHTVEHHKLHKFTYTAMLTGMLLSAAGLMVQFYLTERYCHPLEGYAIIVPGVALFLRSLHPPIGFVRIFTTLAGGVCLGAAPLFYVSGSPNPPWISIGLIFVAMAILGASFTVRTTHGQKHHHP
ncbi:hypothetical protein [Pontiella sulfatireligans]|uniref:Uncharacterized protein n=1 Tax=Pontiella sulfatireligans TaxID=2750658 RepID=A0A6C2UQM1_9BACT|nr:hypothetical protein [Pontiella sulfatireligans]VGO22585.1 hypothetical protein SCARR_04670 [Pontiella sulfatireligans]